MKIHPSNHACHASVQLLLLLAVTTVIACGGARQAPSSPKIPPVGEAPGDCEVALQFWYDRDEQASPTQFALASKPSCLKHVGKSFKLDSNIQIYVPIGGRDFYYCADERVLDDELERCTWNGRFRDAYPLTFRLWSPSGKQPLRHLVQLVDVFRNGTLAFRTEVSEETVLVPGKRLQADGVPHLADFDLRIYPAGVVLDEELLRRELREGSDKFRRRFEIGLRVATAELTATGFERDAMCLLAYVHGVRQELAQLADEPPPPGLLEGDPPAGCRKPEDLTSLQKEYQAAKGQVRQNLDQSMQQFVNGVGLKLDISTDRLRTDLADLRKKAPPSETLRRIDDVARETLGAIDDARVMVTRVRYDVQSFIKDDERQVAAYRRVVKHLEDEGDFFEPYTDNPAPVNIETVLRMSYADQMQFYALNPWFGGAIRFSDGGTEPGISYAIPILDVVGMRYQFGRSRWKDVRAGLGMMVFEDKAADGAESQAELRWAPQASVALANLRLGLAWVPAANDETEDYWDNHFRFLLGVDLFKVVTGKNLEVLTSD